MDQPSSSAWRKITADVCIPMNSTLCHIIDGSSNLQQAHASVEIRKGDCHRLWYLSRASMLGLSDDLEILVSNIKCTYGTPYTLNHIEGYVRQKASTTLPIHCSGRSEEHSHPRTGACGRKNDDDTYRRYTAASRREQPQNASPIRAPLVWRTLLYF